MKPNKLATLIIAAVLALAALAVPAGAEEPEAQITRVVANCHSDVYGRALDSFTFYVDSTTGMLDLTTADFETSNCVFDGNEKHNYFGEKAKRVTFTANTMTVELAPFYPDSSFSSDGYWAMTCTDPRFSVDAATPLEISDPVVESFEQLTLTEGDAVLESYLYTPDNAEGALPIVVFNSGGAGVSTTGDLYGANFAVSFAKPEAQAILPCYVLYPQRNTGSAPELATAIKNEVDALVADGKVDPNRIYVTGESAGSLFTMNFVKEFPGYAAAIVIFDGGGEYGAETLEETMLVSAESPFSDEDLQVLAESGTDVMFVQSIGDTTSMPIKYATSYKKLEQFGMIPQTNLFYHTYTAEQFNALLSDRTVWQPMADSEYVTDPITGQKTYNYQEGKLHNSSYPGANDQFIKLWLLMRSKAEYQVEFIDEYSAAHGSDVDYSIIPEKYVKVAVLPDAPSIPAGGTMELTVYTDETEQFYYLMFDVPFSPDPQYVEAVAVAGKGHVVMDSSGTWWTADVNAFTMPYVLSQESIDWQPYER